MSKGSNPSNVTTTTSAEPATPEPPLHRSQLSRHAKRPLRLCDGYVATWSTKLIAKTSIWVQAWRRHLNDDGPAVQREQLVNADELDESDANEQLLDAVAATNGHDEVIANGHDARRRRHANGHESIAHDE